MLDSSYYPPLILISLISFRLLILCFLQNCFSSSISSFRVLIQGFILFKNSSLDLMGWSPHFHSVRMEFNCPLTSLSSFWSFKLGDFEVELPNLNLSSIFII